MSTEKGFFTYGFLTVFVSMGIIYLLTGEFARAANAGCAGTLLVLFGLICIKPN